MVDKKTFTSVITGDIIGSRSTDQRAWLPRLKRVLSLVGKSPQTWQVYRGDSFQVEVKDPSLVFFTAIRIKAAVKTVKNLDVRMAIGIGDKTYASGNVAESAGEAFIRSGEKFEALRKLKQSLAINTPWPQFDREMNIYFRLALIPMDDWTPTSAELIEILISQTNLTQTALAKKLGITQPSISERQNRSHIDEVMDLETLFREKVTNLIATP